jgi:hypothetical protein
MLRKFTVKTESYMFTIVCANILPHRWPVLWHKRLACVFVNTLLTKSKTFLSAHTKLITFWHMKMIDGTYVLNRTFLYHFSPYRPLLIQFILPGYAMSLANIYDHTSVSSTKVPLVVWTVTHKQYVNWSAYSFKKFFHHILHSFGLKLPNLN